jgi:hypothetical protein
LFERWFYAIIINLLTKCDAVNGSLAVDEQMNNIPKIIMVPACFGRTPFLQLLTSTPRRFASLLAPEATPRVVSIDKVRAALEDGGVVAGPAVRELAAEMEAAINESGFFTVEPP